MLILRLESTIGYWRTQADFVEASQDEPPVIRSAEHRSGRRDARRQGRAADWPLIRSEEPMSKAKARWGDKYRGVVVGSESFDADTTAPLAAAIGIRDVEEVEALRRDLNHQINIWRAMKASENKPRGRQVELAITEIVNLTQKLHRRLEQLDFESKAALAHVLATNVSARRRESSGWLALDSIEHDIHHFRAVAERALRLRRFAKSKRGPSPLRNTLANILIYVYERHSGRKLISCSFSPIDGEYQAVPSEALSFIEDCFDQLGEANLQRKPCSVGALIERALRNRSHSEAS